METSKDIGVQYRKIVHILLFFQSLQLIQSTQTHERYAEIFKASKLKSFEGAEQIHKNQHKTKSFERISFTAHNLIKSTISLYALLL